MSQPADQELSSSPPSPQPRSHSRKGKAKQVPQRGPSYTSAEDKVLTSAFLNVTRDPIVGANQPSSTYWQRVSTYYHENLPNCRPRTNVSLTHRWSYIANHCSRFTSYMAEQNRHIESGKTEEDRVRNYAMLENVLLCTMLCLFLQMICIAEE
ncbi:hypothetical protein BAE44_0018050 [Dichanthelium oligosanthes]|uniref:No apical meristem-associated C-terminal domain-containing protein n=1 Tax=Dichanthelium oligosanthes TaxID=888268 RepID=A0A1E5V731_9POAL|nr:hypothetical protein BAE44_0018050 [Dichanthelium oligosanthes]